VISSKAQNLSPKRIMTFSIFYLLLFMVLKKLQKLKQTKTFNASSKTNEFKTHQKIAQTS
jgi:hypothetical protein